MKRAIVSVAALLILVAGVSPAQAQSNPYVDVDTFGIELCPQSGCGAAIFTGVLFGQVGWNPNAFGIFTVAVTHADLPADFEYAALLSGVFELKVGLRRIRGILLPGGTLFNNGDNTFDVTATFLITSGGSGCLAYGGLLNHNVFPPTVIGPLASTVCPI